MVARKERTLLIQVESLDDEPSPPSSALHNELREAIRRAGISNDPMHPRHYSREARLCSVRIPRASTSDVSTAIKSIRYVGRWPVRLSVVRAFGNERLARRAFAARCEDVLSGSLADNPEGQRAVRELLEKLVDLQRA